MIVQKRQSLPSRVKICFLWVCLKDCSIVIHSIQVFPELMRHILRIRLIIQG